MPIKFSDIATNTARVGRWMMTSQLTGKFVEFTTAIHHGEAQGGELRSVI